MVAFRDIFARTGATEMARRIEPTCIAAGIGVVDANTVAGWKRNDSIPAGYFRPIADAEIATLDELADAAAARKRVDA